MTKQVSEGAEIGVFTVILILVIVAVTIVPSEESPFGVTGR